MKPIYLDYNATTPIDPEVLDSMMPYLRQSFGNPSSVHSFGTEAKKAIYRAREQVAGLLNCNPDEIIFTSGGSESNNHAIKGLVFAMKEKGNHLISSSIEHPAVMEVFSYLETQGFRTTYVSVDKFGLIDLDELKESITTSTVLITVMHANNEVGTIEPIEEIAKIAKSRDIVFHTDAAQSAGKIETDISKLGVDLLSVAGHKLYAPKGVGALFVRRGIKLEKFIHGAAHEGGRRAGTENVPYIVGLGKACEIAARDIKKNTDIMQSTRDKLHEGVLKAFPEILLNGHPDKRLPNTLSLSFSGMNANTLLSELTAIAASPGAACHAGSEEISYVLKAMGLVEERGLSTVRFSTGKNTTTDEIEEAVKVISKAVKGLGKGTNGRTQTRTQIGIEIGRKTRAPQRIESRTDSIDEPLEPIKLTQYTQGLGCACKMRPNILEDILKKLTGPADKNIMVGNETKDDAAVYRLDDNNAIVQTVDFFTPIVDDPYRFGEIAAANSLSDIYAMGGKPLFALNIVAFPSKRLPLSVLGEILKGAESKAAEAGISIIGGHTIEDDEPKYGLAVTGVVHPAKVLKNSTAKSGDVLILTKPIGCGIISTAVKRGVAGESHAEKIYEVMAQLNKKASEIMVELGASACTDITGFGLLGHMLELAQGSNVDIELALGKIPIIEGTESFVGMGIYPGGTRSNLDFVKGSVIWRGDIDEVHKIILADAQTSGGLLIAVAREEAAKLVDRLHDAGIRDAAIIGRVSGKGSGKIVVRDSDDL